MKIRAYNFAIYILPSLMLTAVAAMFAFAALGEWFDKWLAWAELRVLLLKAASPTAKGRKV